MLSHPHRKMNLAVLSKYILASLFFKFFFKLKNSYEDVKRIEIN